VKPSAADKEQYFRTIYHTITFGDLSPEIATPAIASLRLLLIESVGEERQRELVSAWNEEAAAYPASASSTQALRRCALDGIAYGFVEAGMPLEWVARQTHIFQYMPPLCDYAEPNELLTLRDDAWRERHWWRARNLGNHLLALAVLAGDEESIQSFAEDNLTILEAWRAAESDFSGDHELEEHRWLREHARAMARWGAIVRDRLEAAG
jgi:hypothetical protein